MIRAILPTLPAIVGMSVVMHLVSGHVTPAFADQSPAYWLVETVPGTLPAVHVVDDYEDAATCFDASLVHVPQSPDGFTVCIPLDEVAEERLLIAATTYE